MYLKRRETILAHYLITQGGRFSVSTCGSGATGKNAYETGPTKPTAAISRAVATGRRMNGSDMFMVHDPAWPAMVTIARASARAGGWSGHANFSEMSNFAQTAAGALHEQRSPWRHRTRLNPTLIGT
jgi:hypothetical protein